MIARGIFFAHSSLNVQLKRFLVEEGENKNVLIV